MEKKYLVAKLANPTRLTGTIVFDDVKNLEETHNDEGELIAFEFDDQDGHYSYTHDGRVFQEDNRKAPDIIEYKTACRRTAKKHGLIDPEHRSSNVIYDEESHKFIRDKRRKLLHKK